METSWRDRKNSLDITALDAAVKAVIDVDLPNGKIPKIMKRHYKENFVRYDIGIGTVGHKDAESYEKTVAGPVFDTIKERAVKNGWKAFYQPSYGSRGSVAWIDYYVQLRIPYDNTTTILEGTCVNSIYNQMNNIDDAESLNENYGIKNTRKLQESTKYEYEVYMDSNSSDEDEFFTDLRLAKKFAKYLAKRYCPQDPGSYAVIRRGPRGGDPNIQEWPIIAKIKDD